MNEGFSWKGKTLLSGIDPAGRAERAARAVAVRDGTLYLCPSPLFGYGLGCLLERIAPFDSAVLCVEAEPELFALALEHIGAALRDNQQLRLSNQCEAETLCALVRQTWGPRFFRRLETVRLNGGWQLHTHIYDALAESLRREIALDWGNAMTLARLGRRYIRNALRNLALTRRCPSLGRLSWQPKGCPNCVPVLVLGAGPSLDQLLDGLQGYFGAALRQPQTRPFKIICVDTCLSALKERGITADLAVILESQHWNLEDFAGLNGWNVPAAFDLSALPQSGAVLAGDLFLFYTPWTTLSIFERLDKAGLLPMRLPPLGSVGLNAAYIARHLTEGVIITAGLDFSFTLDAYHARSTPGHKGKLRRHNRFTSLLNTEAAFGKAVFTAVSANGSTVFSNPSMRGYRELFEREFGGDARFYVIDGSGLPPGIKTLSHNKAFDALCNMNFTTEDTEEASACIPCNSVVASSSEKLQDFIQAEHNRLTLLRNILSGEAPMDSNALAALINECNYLWAHFPDYAALDRRLAKADIEAGGDMAVSFLKRLRVEIDPFLKLWELARITEP